MNYFLASLFTIILPFFSYFFYKTYQLSTYRFCEFFDILFTKGLPFGNKNELVFTKRMARIIFCHILVCACLIFVVFVYVHEAGLIFLDILMIYIFSPMLLLLCHFIMLPIEILIKQYYIKKAKCKLAQKDVKIIGITGSYGKTSTKNILASILEKCFKVCKTPLNYNTEMGLTKTILQKLDDEDFLIAEMGARHKGDIKKLCQIAKPDYCIITTVGAQHLQTFGNIETVMQTKSEIIENSKRDAVVFVNCDSPYSNKIYQHCVKAKFATCRYSAYAYASDICYSQNGSTFILNLDNQQIKIKTQLLGRHNIDNIVTAAAFAYYLGVSKNDIANAIKSLKATPHRLELIKKSNVCILDDSYNSNPTGSMEALNVLSTFKGKKIVVTPGFVELGQESGEANFKLGVAIADVADNVIVMNQTNKNFILSGLISHNFDTKKVFFANSLKEQKNILSKLVCDGCVVLFENDLPDNYK